MLSTPRFPVEGIVYPSEEQARSFIASGGWHDLTIPDQLARCVANDPTGVAFTCEGRDWTFSDVDRAARGVAQGLLSAGLRPGDRALFQMGTLTATQIAVLGCMLVGVLPVCTIPQYRQIEIGAIAEITRPKAYFVQGDFTTSTDLAAFARAMCDNHGIATLVTLRDSGMHGDLRLEDLMTSQDTSADLSAYSPAPGDAAVLQLSGGSTGLPKIIPRFHGEYLAHTQAWLDRYDTTKDDTRIWALPLLHNAGMMFALLGTLLYANKTVLMPQWTVAEFFEQIERHGVGIAFTIGPHAPIIAGYEGIKDHDLSSLRCFLTLIGAEGIEKATGVTAINMFGITEGLVLTSTPHDPPALRHGTIGRTCSAHDEVKLLDIGTEEEVAPGETGELCFRGPSSLPGYFAAPDVNAVSFSRDGFFRTGDLVSSKLIDGVPTYSFEGRVKDNINRGGEKFGTEEVERLLCDHAAIRDAKVVAMPDPVYGEKACAYLILNSGQTMPTPGDLVGFLTERGLAKFKVPERLEQVESFPTTRVGKLDRAALRQDIADRIASENAEVTS